MNFIGTLKKITDMIIYDGYMGYWHKFLIYTVDVQMDIFTSTSVSIAKTEKRDYIINSVKRK